ncbi:GIY-YIG nuclease family protein [Coleofasciculus sp. FACHB-501]|uniref:GIY-YIG nuclease family protein n=1 Tax=Cyanophyceae TaxID=3028117 RepID=UPI001F559022|nr:GIY-YIG nuclease family protein [Coleofasciculus sp. FACHB-501]
MEPNQLDLFDSAQLTSCKRRPNVLLMDAVTLARWKSQIAAHQQRTRESQPGKQVTLFDLTPQHCDPEQIDPLTLRLDTLSFFERPGQDVGEPCIYFVVDTEAKLILYVGETLHSNQRWRGTHDAKRYISQYISLHRQYQLDVAVCISFWWDAPSATRSRQALEKQLILKWRSPFNKENWQRWGQPFG